jgi:hypothetical protein
MGARDAGYVLLRLPLEICAHYPVKLKQMLSLMRAAREANSMIRRADDRIWLLCPDDRAQVRGGGRTGEAVFQPPARLSEQLRLL